MCESVRTYKVDNNLLTIGNNLFIQMFSHHNNLNITRHRILYQKGNALIRVSINISASYIT